MNDAQLPSRLVWLDLEMTGLDPEANVIIEIATIVTDTQLNELAVGPVLAIHQPEEELAKMDEWNRKQHGKSGLIDRVCDSKTSAAEAETQTLHFLRDQLEAGVSPLCGNSVCMDKRFLARHMPHLHAFFHYRLLDVSSLKILAGLWFPQVARKVSKNSEHLALADIRDSISELKFYRDSIFIAGEKDIG